MGKAFRSEQWPIAMLQQAIRQLGRCTAKQEPALVIDLFAGSHTTAVAAHTCGCAYIGVDIDPEAEKVGRFHFRRLTQTALYAKDSALLGNTPTKLDCVVTILFFST